MTKLKSTKKIVLVERHSSSDTRSTRPTETTGVLLSPRNTADKCTYLHVNDMKVTLRKQDSQENLRGRLTGGETKKKSLREGV